MHKKSLKRYTESIVVDNRGHFKNYVRTKPPNNIIISFFSSFTSLLFTVVDF